MVLLNGMYLNGYLYYSGLCTTHGALSSVWCYSEWLYKTVKIYALLSRYLLPIYNTPTC